jgi:hypothetical protein
MTLKQTHSLKGAYAIEVIIRTIFIRPVQEDFITILA